MKNAVVIIAGMIGLAIFTFLLNLILKGIQSVAAEHPWIKRFSKIQILLFGGTVFILVSLVTIWVKPFETKKEAWERTSIKIINAVPTPGTDLTMSQLVQGIEIVMDVEVNIEPPYDWKTRKQEPHLVLDWLERRDDPNKSVWNPLDSKEIDAGGIKRMGLSGTLTEKMIRNGKITIQTKVEYFDSATNKTMTTRNSDLEIDYPVAQNIK
jgi:hypothetical protein